MRCLESLEWKKHRKWWSCSLYMKSVYELLLSRLRSQGIVQIVAKKVSNRATKYSTAKNRSQITADCFSLGSEDSEHRKETRYEFIWKPYFQSFELAYVVETWLFVLSTSVIGSIPYTFFIHSSLDNRTKVNFRNHSGISFSKLFRIHLCVL